MFIPSLANVRNIRAATPGALRMPAPTIETFTMPVSRVVSRAPISLATSRISFWVRLASSRLTVKEMSVRPSSEMFWTIISTTTLCLATVSKIIAAIPGRSGTPRMVTFAWSLLDVTPATVTSSMPGCLSTTIVPSPAPKADFTRMGTPWRLPNSTLLAWSTFAPRLASSSISS